MNRVDTATAAAAYRVVRAVAGTLVLLALWLVSASPVRAQSVELTTFELSRADGALMLDFVARPVLSKAVAKFL